MTWLGIRIVWFVFIISLLYEFLNSVQNSIDPDQTLRSVASDLGVHCLQTSLLWDARHKMDKKVHIYPLICLKSDGLVQQTV